MRSSLTYTILSLIFVLIGFSLNGQSVFTIYGKIVNQKDSTPVSNASILILNSNYATTTNKKGEFRLSFPKKQHVSLLISHLSFFKKTKELDPSDKGDSVFLYVSIKEKQNILDSITIESNRKPETLVHSGRFSIYDFDFYEDNFILLTSEKGLDKAELKFSDEAGRIIHTTKIPKEAGLAKELYHDYMGFTNIICENAIYRIVVYNKAFILFKINANDYNAFIKPIIDTINGKLIFSDYWKDYPMFNYLSWSEKDSIRKKLITITNKDLLEAYNFEYYAMKPREMLEARRLADELKVDKSVIAALMTGFTKSMYYEPLFAPLFILKDTICVFDHYKDMLFHFDLRGHKIDSVAISYNHPKNWHEWKRQMLKDDVENAIYAIYNKDGHKYLKQIDHTNGKVNGRYTIQFHSADKIKIKDGYIYYVYRPFESTQEKFLYREYINLKNAN